MQWEVLLHDDVERWLLALARDAPEVADEVAAAIDKLAEDGPDRGAWASWYTINVPLADDRFDEHLGNRKEQTP